MSLVSFKNLFSYIKKTVRKAHSVDDNVDRIADILSLMTVPGSSKLVTIYERLQEKKGATRSSKKRKILEGVLVKISKREAAFLPSDTEYAPPLASTANSNSMTTTRLTRLFDELSHEPSISRQASISSSNSILADHLPEDTLDMQKLHQKKREEIRPKRFIENNWVYTAPEVVARKISHAFARKEELDETLAVVGSSSDDEDADSLVGVVNSDLDSDDDGNFGLSQDVREHRSTHKELEFVGSDDCWGLDADMVPTLFIP